MPPAEAMSMELIYQVMYEALSLSDSSLQIWVTHTFALMAAAHFAGDRVSGITCKVVCSLYGLYAAVLIGSGTFLLMIGGTVLALWFVRRVRQEHLGKTAAGTA